MPLEVKNASHSVAMFSNGHGEQMHSYLIYLLGLLLTSNIILQVKSTSMSMHLGKLLQKIKVKCERAYYEHIYAPPPKIE